MRLFTRYQYLLHKGYVVLSVDYRGGIGYGVAFEQANYLKFAQTDWRTVSTALGT